jgi:TonB-dependent starch-binding outer membrane protein SusC
MKKVTLVTLISLLCFAGPLFGQQQVHGRVLTSSSDESLIGVTVTVKGTQAGTVTDLNGNYSIKALPADTLVFSYLEYEKVYEVVGNREVIDVEMVPDIKTLSEVVVIGYGTVRKIDLTGSVTSVKTNDLPITATTSIDNLLQGRAAGLNLTSRTAQPGGGLSVNIRGDISPNGDNSPLYVIDGVPITDNRNAEPALNDDVLGYYGGIDRSALNTINPSDIESVDILKDASAAAIYGSDAANGVILITTKKGKEGKTHVEYRGSYTIQTPKKYFDLLDATQFRQQVNRMRYETWLFNNDAAPYGSVDPATIIPEFTYPFTQQQIDEAGTGTDWLDVVIRNGNVQEHNLSLTGGNQNTKVFTSFNYYSNKAILDKSDLKRYTGRINLDQKLGKRINTSMNLTFSQINSNNAATGSNDGGVEKYNMLQAAYSFAPDREIYDSLGNFTYSYDGQVTNPAAFLIIDDKLRTNRFSIIPKIDAKIMDNLSLIATGGMDRQTAVREYYLPVRAQRSNVTNGMAQLGNNRIDNYSAESYLNYSREFANSNLTVVAGVGYYKSLNDGFSLVGRGFFTDALGYNNVSIASEKLQNTISSYKSERTKISQFFRINYSLNDKYLVTFVGRRDGSDYFAPNKKYGFFPGISAAWKLNKEDFLSNTASVSELKLRAGYGTAGNMSVLGLNSMKIYNPGAQFTIGETPYTGVLLAQEDNPNLSWETDVTINVGLDFGFLSNRFTGSIDYFDKTAKDLLDYKYVPVENIIRRRADNIGSTRSTGFEVMVRSNNIVTSKFKWSTDLSVAKYKVFWVERNPDEVLPSYVGKNDEIHAIYGWETDGLIKSDADRPSYQPDAYLGTIRYVDQNGDGILDENDVVQIGNTDPKWSIGFGNTLTIGNFDLNFYFYGYLKRASLMGYRPGGGNSTTGSTQYSISVDPPGNVQTSILDVWTSDNLDGIYPGVAPDLYAAGNPTLNTHLPSSNQFYNVKDDFYLRDASFLRLKNVTLGYTLPFKNILNSVHSVRFYLDLQNVVVLTKYEGFDPEYSDLNPYPQAFSTTFGVNVNF